MIRWLQKLHAKGSPSTIEFLKSHAEKRIERTNSKQIAEAISIDSRRVKFSILVDLVIVVLAMIKNGDIFSIAQ